jgi:hypothetical protein
MKTPNINHICHLLFGSAVLCAFLSSPSIVGPIGASVFAYLSTFLILSRAIAEWFRPPGESWKAIGWGVAVMIVYAVVMPFWAKVNALHASACPVIPALAAGAVFLNLIVPVLRAVLNRTGRPV